MAWEVLMSLKEVDRYAVIELVLRRTMEQSDAALWLGVFVRHVKRLPRAVRDQGTAGVISRLRCAKKHRRLPRKLAAYASEHGRLVVLYSDRHCIFTKHDPEDPEPIECERTVGELNIESILARSQKAKELQSSCAA